MRYRDAKHGRCTLRRDAPSKKKTKRATADAISPEPDIGGEIVMGSDGDGLDSGEASDRGESFQVRCVVLVWRLYELTSD